MLAPTLLDNQSIQPQRGGDDWTPDPPEFRVDEPPLLSWRIQRLMESCEGTPASNREHLARLRRQICADCEYYGDPDCTCPLIALPFTSEGHRILDRELRGRAMQSPWYEDAPETD